jgi:hypothetical protein
VAGKACHAPIYGAAAIRAFDGSDFQQKVSGIEKKVNLNRPENKENT